MSHSKTASAQLRHVKDMLKDCRAGCPDCRAKIKACGADGQRTSPQSRSFSVGNEVGAHRNVQNDKKLHEERCIMRRDVN